MQVKVKLLLSALLAVSVSSGHMVVPAPALAQATAATSVPVASVITNGAGIEVARTNNVSYTLAEARDLAAAFRQKNPGQDVLGVYLVDEEQKLPVIGLSAGPAGFLSVITDRAAHEQCSADLVQILVPQDQVQVEVAVAAQQDLAQINLQPAAGVTVSGPSFDRATGKLEFNSVVAGKRVAMLRVVAPSYSQISFTTAQGPNNMPPGFQAQLVDDASTAAELVQLWRLEVDGIFSGGFATPILVQAARPDTSQLRLNYTSDSAFFRFGGILPASGTAQLYSQGTFTTTQEHGATTQLVVDNFRVGIQTYWHTIVNGFMASLQVSRTVAGQKYSETFGVANPAASGFPEDPETPVLPVYRGEGTNVQEVAAHVAAVRQKLLSHGGVELGKLEAQSGPLAGVKVSVKLVDAGVPGGWQALNPSDPTGDPFNQPDPARRMFTTSGGFSTGPSAVRTGPANIWNTRYVITVENAPENLELTPVFPSSGKRTVVAVGDRGTEIWFDTNQGNGSQLRLSPNNLSSYYVSDLATQPGADEAHTVISGTVKVADNYSVPGLDYRDSQGQWQEQPLAAAGRFTMPVANITQFAVSGFQYSRGTTTMVKAAATPTAVQVAIKGEQTTTVQRNLIDDFLINLPEPSGVARYKVSTIAPDGTVTPLADKEFIAGATVDLRSLGVNVSTGGVTKVAQIVFTPQQGKLAAGQAPKLYQVQVRQVNDEHDQTAGVDIGDCQVAANLGMRLVFTDYNTARDKGNLLPQLSSPSSIDLTAATGEVALVSKSYPARTFQLPEKITAVTAAHLTNDQQLQVRSAVLKALAGMSVTSVVVSSDGHAVVTYDDHKQTTFTPEQLLKPEIVLPERVLVANANQLTDSEAASLQAAVAAATKGQVQIVGNRVQVTYANGLQASEQIAALVSNVLVAAPTPVLINPSGSLTDAEKAAVETAVRETNVLPPETTVTVADDGTVELQLPSGAEVALNKDQTVQVRPANWERPKISIQSTDELVENTSRNRAQAVISGKKELGVTGTITFKYYDDSGHDQTVTTELKKDSQLYSFTIKGIQPGSILYTTINPDGGVPIQAEPALVPPLITEITAPTSDKGGIVRGYVDPGAIVKADVISDGVATSTLAADVTTDNEFTIELPAISTPKGKITLYAERNENGEVIRSNETDLTEWDYTTAVKQEEEKPSSWWLVALFAAIGLGVFMVKEVRDYTAQVRNGQRPHSSRPMLDFIAWMLWLPPQS